MILNRIILVLLISITFNDILADTSDNSNSNVDNQSHNFSESSLALAKVIGQIAKDFGELQVPERLNNKNEANKINFENELEKQVYYLAKADKSLSIKAFDDYQNSMTQIKSKSLELYKFFLECKYFFLKENWKKVTLLAENLNKNKGLSSEMKNEIYEMLYQSYWKLGSKNKSLKYLVNLERRNRYKPNHPQILFELLKVHQSFKKPQLCYWVTKLYKDYPFYTKVSDWTMNQKQFIVNKKNFSCRFSFDDNVRRVKRLFWAGKIEKAETDILNLIQKHPKKFENEYLMALLEERKGHYKEALKILLPYFDEKSKDNDYLNLVSNITGAMGDLNLSRKAYTLMGENSRGFAKSRSLFYKAFLSYQYQDYDRALNDFNQLIMNSSPNRFVAEAEWYIAWIYYLKQDYSNAIQRLNSLKSRMKLRHLRRSTLSINKVNYWLAMSYYKNQQFAEASKIFYDIVNSKNYDFYKIASLHRLNIKELNIQINEERGLASYTHSELSILEDPESNPIEINRKNNDESDVLKGLDEFLHQPIVRGQTNLIKYLYKYGLEKWSNNEIMNLSQLGNSKRFRMLQLACYHAIGNYNKEAYLSELFFSKEKLEIDQSYPYWQSSFPLAFNDDVSKASQFFAVPKEFIYSIMRAESFYKEKAESNVGAKGLMQVMPHTAKKIARLMGDELDLNNDSLFVPQKNIKIGSRYLNRLLRMFKGQMALAAASYNAGPHRVTRWLGQFGFLDSDEFIEHIPYGQTRRYVKKVIKHYDLYQRIYGNKLSLNKSLKDLAWLSEKMTTVSFHPSIYKENWDPIQ